MATTNITTVIVTGAAGFIGSNFVRHLIRHNSLAGAENKKYSILAVDKAGQAKFDLMLGPKNKHYTALSDVNIAELGTSALETADIIYNFASESHVDDSIDGPDAFIQSNVADMQKFLANICQCKESARPRLIHMSTDEVYGDRADSPTSESASAFEHYPFRPSSVYAASKAAQEALIQAYSRSHNLRYTIARCTNVYGPRQLPNKFIPRSIWSILNNRQIELYGDGKQSRSWTPIDVVCQMLLRLGNKFNVINDVFNIGSGVPVGNLSIAKQIITLLTIDHGIDIDFEDFIQYVADRPGHDVLYQVSTSKFIDVCGHYPEASGTHYLPSTVVWYAQNVDWIKSAFDFCGGDHRKGLGK